MVAWGEEKARSEEFVAVADAEVLRAAVEIAAAMTVRAAVVFVHGPAIACLCLDYTASNWKLTASVT